MDDGSQLLKALNVLMLKILVILFSICFLFAGFLRNIFLTRQGCLFSVQDNADRTSSFVVLINLLRPLEPSRWPSTGSKESFASRNQKFSDLVVKCLIKLTKVVFIAPTSWNQLVLFASLSELPLTEHPLDLFWFFEIPNISIRLAFSL